MSPIARTTACPSCGLAIPDDVGLCPHHHDGYGCHDWAVANRIMCDFVHRRRVPRRLKRAERDDDLTEFTRLPDADGYILLQISRASEASP
jgi:hypothetical protein